MLTTRKRDINLLFYWQLKYSDHRVTYAEHTNCSAAIFPLVHKSLQDRTWRESCEREANGARSTTMSSVRQVYKVSSTQTLNIFTHTFWNWLANTPRKKTNLKLVKNMIVVTEDIHWKWECTIPVGLAQIICQHTVPRNSMVELIYV